MANPLIIGGIVIGGALTVWRMVRERGRIKRMVETLDRQAAEESKVIPLERDPRTGVYAPRRERGAQSSP